MAARATTSADQFVKSIVLLCLVVFSSIANADVVVPNANASVDADTINRFPLLVFHGMRYQQVYAASEFSSFSPEGELITGIAFRPDKDLGAPFGPLTLDDLTIGLSTTDSAPDALSATFSDNVGAHYKQVLNGSVTISSVDSPGPGDTRAFDVLINFDVPFLYNPTNGNLLLDILNGDEDDHDIGVFFDAEFTVGDTVSRAWGPEGTPSAVSGGTSSSGLVTLFITRPVPEPNSLAISSVALCVVIRQRSRSTAQHDL